jgi:hypothetical protein
MEETGDVCLSSQLDGYRGSSISRKRQCHASSIVPCFRQYRVTSSPPFCCTIRINPNALTPEAPSVGHTSPHNRNGAHAEASCQDLIMISMATL